MMRILSLVVLLLASLAPAQPSKLGDFAPQFEEQAGDPTGSVEIGQEVTIRFVPLRTQVRPGDQIPVAIVMTHAPGYHSWPSIDQPVLPESIRDFAIRTNVAAGALDEDFAFADAKLRVGVLPETITVGAVQWPEPHEAAVADPLGGLEPIMVPTYSDEAAIFIPLVVSPDATVGSTIEVPFHIAWQACNDTACLNPMAETETIRFEIVEQTAVLEQGADASIFEGFDNSAFENLVDVRKVVEFNVFGWAFSINTTGPVGLVLLLLAAAAGGLILNFTPCVMPVIPIKIMGLSQAAGNPAKCFLLGLVMSLGVVAFWLTIGSLIAFVGSFGQINQLFQFPMFVLGVGILILVFGLGMLGLFSTGLPNWVYRINPKHDSMSGSFVFGIMTAVLSTPCTAPFMGAAAAWATLQPSSITLATFGAIGAGMALPYLVLSAFPSLVNRIPRTGPASELVKQVMGIFLIAVAMFFLGNGLAPFFKGPTDPAPRWYWWFVGAAIVAAMGWMIVRTIKITTRIRPRAIVTVLGLVGIVGSVYGAMTLSSHGPIDWEYYDEATFATYFDGSGEATRVLVVDFTAEWCLNCKALESAVLHQKEIVDLLHAEGVVPVKVDITGNNPEGKALLERLEWVGIPLLAIYGPGVDEPLKFDSYGVETVRSAIERASGSALTITPDTGG